MTPLLLLLALVAGAGAGALAATARLARTRQDPRLVQARHEADLLRVRTDEAQQRAGLEAEIAALEATIGGLRHQLADTSERQREQAERERQEARVLQALAPVQETLRGMQTKVSELEQQRAAQYGALEQQLTAARTSTEQVRATAESLAAALKSNSVRGAWGEAQLRRLVEAAGLTNRVDFDLQVSTRSDDGVRRPDLVVRLPEGKCIAVDAKVPLAAFLEASEIPAGAPGAEGARREALLQEHVKAVRAHIDALAAKGYWTDFTSPEFVVAFLPSESLLSSALAADPSLLDYAFGKRVALASPVNLWAVLRTVAFTWTQQALTEDAQRLFTLSRTLYDRIGVLAGKAEKLRGALERSVGAYNEFVGTLETRVLVTARQIGRMDQTAVLPEPSPIDTVPRPLTAPELVEERPRLSAVD
ncbi:DNA recombination protein RmuC [Amnibacterium sp. CER49]|uniref:DNA recombination protein RmuC n=1 Tax=Amnibacterium sp. CER49 TaxID=3039161 RepID=UPI00244C4902|nr:DNA recombination protein RmuC [Amnibacterium sp. CER49]MDH2445363.1 DNA recombination protein RmuC [Amnibacterium sp. CER49]